MVCGGGLGGWLGDIISLFGDMLFLLGVYVLCIKKVFYFVCEVNVIVEIYLVL